jgi:hypothetical protein
LRPASGLGFKVKAMKNLRPASMAVGYGTNRSLHTFPYRTLKRNARRAARKGNTCSVYVSESAWPRRCARERAQAPQIERERGICLHTDATNIERNLWAHPTHPTHQTHASHPTHASPTRTRTDTTYQTTDTTHQTHSHCTPTGLGFRV